jgi:hypothetical protein
MADAKALLVNSKSCIRLATVAAEVAALACLQGYALSVFIPISFVCIVNNEIVRWLLVALATFTSGLFLLSNFRTPIYESAGARCGPLHCVVSGSRPSRAASKRKSKPLWLSRVLIAINVAKPLQLLWILICIKWRFAMREGLETHQLTNDNSHREKVQKRAESQTARKLGAK